MIEEILDQCLRDIRAKRATLADCLKKYPEYASELRPLLETALFLETAPDVKPSLAFKLRTRAQLVQLAPPAPSRRFPFLLPRFSLATAAAIVLIVLGLTSGLVYAAGDSLPDSPLYPIKRRVEGIQLVLAPDPESQARTYMTFAERRLSEAQALANKPDQAALAEQTIAEYNNQVAASLAAVPTAQTSTAPLVQELTNRLTQQQDNLKTLENKVSAPAFEKVKNAAEQAKEKLHSLALPVPVSVPPVAVPTTIAPTLVPVTPRPTTATPVPAATNTPAPPTQTTVPPITATPVATPPLSLPTIGLPGVTVAAPTVASIPPQQGPPPIVPQIPTIGLPRIP